MEDAAPLHGPCPDLARGSSLVRCEVTLQALPAAGVVGLQLGRLQGKARGLYDPARLEHERHGIREAIRPRSIRAARPRIRFSVGSMAAHAIVKRGAARAETVRLGIIEARDQ